MKILGPSNSSSEERSNIGSAILDEDKIREIVSDSIDYYLGRYRNNFEER